MNRIASFSVDHDKIVRGIYISRIDGDVTTYDLRTRIPNADDFMSNVAMHSMEHMFATYVRNSEIAENVIYFGPMGCRTGFYLLVRNEAPEKVLEVVKDVLYKIKEHQGEMFGATRKECGNYKELDVCAARREARMFLQVLEYADVTFKYPS